MRGRKPTPTSVKHLQGNPGKRRLNLREPKPVVRAPACPRELSPAAKNEWRRIARHLPVLNLVTDLDRAMLAVYCAAYGLWAEAIAATDKFGSMVKSPSGYPMQSPYVAIANKQAELMIRIAAEFGFTPSSRPRIDLPPPRVIDDPGEKYFDDLESNSRDRYFRSSPSRRFDS